MGAEVIVLIAPNPNSDPMDHEDHLVQSFVAQLGAVSPRCVPA